MRCAAQPDDRGLDRAAAVDVGAGRVDPTDHACGSGPEVAAVRVAEDRGDGTDDRGSEREVRQRRALDAQDRDVVPPVEPNHRRVVAGAVDGDHRRVGLPCHHVGVRRDEARCDREAGSRQLEPARGAADEHDGARARWCRRAGRRRWWVAAGRRARPRTTGTAPPPRSVRGCALRAAGAVRTGRARPRGSSRVPPARASPASSGAPVGAARATPARPAPRARPR